jgi:hypothetical protein
MTEEIFTGNNFIDKEDFCKPLVSNKLLDDLNLSNIMENQMLLDSIFKEELIDLKQQLKRNVISIDGCNARIEHALKNSIKRIKLNKIEKTLI